MHFSGATYPPCRCRHLDGQQVAPTGQLHTRSARLVHCVLSWRSLSIGELFRSAWCWIAAVMAFGFALDTSAQENKFEVQLLAEVKTSVNGLDNKLFAHFTPATTLSQGELVYYTVRIRNPTSEYLRDVTVVQPVPVNTMYAEHSASGPGADIQFSADGGLTFAAEDRLLITDSGGVQRTATPSDFTHIRWRLRNALAPGAVALARFQAVFR
jgi:hypothetical protein